MPLGKRTDCGDARFAGYEIQFSDKATDVLVDEVLQNLGFDFALCPITNPAYRPPPLALHDSSQPYPEGPSSHECLYFKNSEYSGRLVACTSTWIDCDHPTDRDAAEASCKWLRHELSWAQFLGLHAVVVSGPKHGAECARFAREVASFLSQETVATRLWLRIPVSSGADVDQDGDDTWQWWHAFRCINEHSTNLGVALELTETLPSDERLARWYGENVKCCIVPQSVFLTNRQGFPVLPQRHQLFLSELVTRGVQVLFSPSYGAGIELTLPSLGQKGDGQRIGEGEGSGDDSEGGPPHPHKIYQEYFAYFFRNVPRPSDRETHEIEYRDYLQHPLQPLQDNLESSTYEVFEFDKMKYVQYEEAVYHALLHRVPEAQLTTATTVLMVVGAGRGPLVRASLRASQRSGRRLRVYAVEKNPHAVVVLRRMVEEEPEMRGVVTIVHCDMRSWRAPEQADILVSELLGSWGDNELSPECLDGAQRFLKRDGISIPQSYTSYLQPITAHKVWTDARSFRAAGKDATSSLETPFVVKLHKITRLGTIEEVFTFVHPNWRAEEEGKPIDNERYARLRFSRPAGTGDCLVHGFAGYFSCVLFGHVHLGIHPGRHTPDMHSWFPLFIPVREPFTWREGQELVMDVWRCVSPQKVWYEWCVAGPVPSGTMNLNGRSYFVGL